MFSPSSFCSRCGEQLQPTANFCPRCAIPVQSAPTHSFTPVVDITPTKKVGVGLGLGILFLPYIFSWFTLRQGHTTLAKTVSFIWLGVFVLAWATRSSELTKPQPNLRKTRHFVRLALISNGPRAALAVMVADFTITNLSNYTVKDLDVTCTHYANSGTEIDSNSRTIYETVPAKGKKGCA